MRRSGNNELLGTWPRVDAAMDKLFSDDTFKYPDADGEPFKIGWFFNLDRLFFKPAWQRYGAPQGSRSFSSVGVSRLWLHR